MTKLNKQLFVVILIISACGPVVNEPTTIQPKFSTAFEYQETFPKGVPDTEWQGIPIMSRAINGEGDDEYYQFTTSLNTKEIQDFYYEELINLGWKLSVFNEIEMNTKTQTTFYEKEGEMLSLNILQWDDSFIIVTLYK